MYADDIILLIPSVADSQELLNICENALRDLDLSVNPNKSVCMRIGPRCNSQCSGIVTGDGHVLAWVECVRYSDVYCVRPRQFKCKFDNAKTSFYYVFNAVFGRIGGSGSVEVN